MRNRALSVLRAQQLIIEQCNATNDCLDVNTRNFGSTPRKGVAPGNLYKRTGTIGSAAFSSSIVSQAVAARNSRPASAIRVLIRRVQHREPRTAPRDQKCYVLLSTGGTAMRRNRALSVLRARQMIVEQCHVTIDCFDVATHLMGLPVRIGEPQSPKYKGHES